MSDQPQEGQPGERTYQFTAYRGMTPVLLIERQSATSASCRPQWRVSRWKVRTEGNFLAQVLQSQATLRSRLRYSRSSTRARLSHRRIVMSRSGVQWPSTTHSEIARSISSRRYRSVDRQSRKRSDHSSATASTRVSTPAVRYRALRPEIAMHQHAALIAVLFHERPTCLECAAASSRSEEHTSELQSHA